MFADDRNVDCFGKFQNFILEIVVLFNSCIRMFGKKLKNGILSKYKLITQIYCNEFVSYLIGAVNQLSGKVEELQKQIASCAKCQ